jgi:enoyl-CoA hydratase/carnithine racemase
VNITLDRPAKRNALTKDMYHELVAAYGRFNNDPSARVAVLRGEGPTFCAGRDIADQAETNESPTGHIDTNAVTQYGLPPTSKITVAAARGHAYGGGATFILECDLRIVTSDLVFALTEVPTGVLGPYWLGAIESIPRQLAFRLAVLGEAFSAKELGSAVFTELIEDDDQLDAVTAKWVQRLLELPPEHAFATKQLMNKVASFQWTTEVARQEYDVRARLDALDDTAEAAQAFVERRPPVFHGR